MHFYIIQTLIHVFVEYLPILLDWVTSNQTCLTQHLKKADCMGDTRNVTLKMCFSDSL